MTVVLEFADGPAGNAVAEFNACCEAGDDRQQDRLLDLFYDGLVGRYGECSEARLAARLGRLRVWRREGDFGVYRTPGLPTAAFAPLSHAGEPVVLVLGFSLSLPHGEEAWWTGTIRPRLLGHL